MHSKLTKGLLAALLAGAALGLCMVSLSSAHTQEPGQVAPDAGATTQALEPEPTSPEPVVLNTDASGVFLEWTAPDFSERRVAGGDGRWYSSLQAPGWVQTAVAGQPQLPVASVLVVAPPTGEVTLQVTVAEQERRLLQAPVVPAPRVAAVGSPPSDVAYAWARDERVYAAVLPRSTAAAPWVAMEEAGWARGHRLVRLTFTPFRFDPQGLAVDVAGSVRVALRFQGGLAGTGSGSDDDPFTPLLQNSVVNPGQVNLFARVTQPLATSGAPSDTQYLVIAHSNFVTAVAPLIAHRALSDGLRVFTVTTQQIYAAYSGGVVTATAIRNYISDTYHSAATPTLQYVLLVGDGVESGTSGQYVPPFMLQMKPTWWAGSPWWAASDGRYAMVDGNDRMPDVFLGRLPVKTAAQATTVVTKILSYEMGVQPQWPWNERVLFFAGHEDPLAIPSETFHDDSDHAVSSHVPITYTKPRVYFCTAGCSQPYMITSISAARDGTIGYLNTGGLFASYVGHSSQNQWDADPTTLAPMFHQSDVVSLTNAALPVFLEMTCYTSRFSDPSGDTLDETLLRRSGGGAVATWGSTALGLSSGHKVLHGEFLDAVFIDGVTVLGSAIRQAELAISPYSDWQDLLDSFLLLGDPALKLNRTVVPWSQETYLPTVLRN